MKKAKKYIYPLIFSATFLILYFFLMFLLDKVISFPYGSFAPAAWLVLFAFAWLIVVIPIYCFKYCKLIREEKLKFLFAVYNPFIIVFCHIGPFISGAGPRALNVIIKIAIFLFVWALFWSVLFFKPRVKSCEESEQLSENKTQE